MIGIVWGSTQGRAIKKLEEIRKDYFFNHFNIIRVRRDFFEAENGDIWRAVVADNSARGYRCNISYIDELIPNEVKNGLIAHATSAYPYQATHYYE